MTDISETLFKDENERENFINEYKDKSTLVYVDKWFGEWAYNVKMEYVEML